MDTFESAWRTDQGGIAADAKLECGICWQVYDPAEGDPVWQIPPGTAFVDLPERWACPNCDAGKEKFMLLGDAAG